MKVGQRQRHLWVYHQHQPADNFAIWRPYTTLLQNNLCIILQMCSVYGPKHHWTNLLWFKYIYHETRFSCWNHYGNRKTNVNDNVLLKSRILPPKSLNLKFGSSILRQLSRKRLASVNTRLIYFAPIIQYSSNVQYKIYTYKNSVKPRNYYDKFRCEHENGKICARKRRVFKTFSVEFLPKWMRVYSLELVKSS